MCLSRKTLTECCSMSGRVLLWFAECPACSSSEEISGQVISLSWCVIVCYDVFFLFFFRCRFYHIERWIKIYIYINYTVTKNKQIVFTITLKLFHKYPSNLANSVGYKCLTMNKITFGVSRSMERRHVLSMYFLACFHCVSSLVKNTLYVVVCVIYVYLLITLRAS